VDKIYEQVLAADVANVAWALFKRLWPEEEWDAEHLANTPERFVQMLKELTTPPDIKWKTFASEADEMVVVKDIPFSSLCAHHLVPFTGRAHVAYVPNGRICGLSKLARVVHHFAAALQVQEELTSQIANYLNDKLSVMEEVYDGHLPSDGPAYDQHYPIGVAVVLEAEHFCMALRGVKVHGTSTVTSKMLGCFADHSRQARTEFLQLIRR
jgi:GTP cyclohydrolase IA